MRLKYLILGLIIIIISCNPDQEIDWKLDKIPQRLVVEGLITNELNKQIITLKKSDEYFANKKDSLFSAASNIKIHLSIPCYCKYK